MLSNCWRFHGEAWRQDCFFRPSSNFLELLLFFSFFFFFKIHLDSISVLPTSNRTKWTRLETIVTVCIASINIKWHTEHTDTCTRHSTAHMQTCQGVSFIRTLSMKAALLFDRLRDWFTSLLYFTQGAKMGRRKQSRTRDSQQKKLKLK